MQTHAQQGGRGQDLQRVFPIISDPYYFGRGPKPFFLPINFRPAPFLVFWVAAESLSLEVLGASAVQRHKLLRRQRKTNQRLLAFYKQINKGKTNEV